MKADASNPDFYGQFNKVHVIYGENLPKGHGEDFTHGTLGSAIESGVMGPWIPFRTMSDVWDRKDAVLRELVSAGRISERMSHALENDRARFETTLKNVPWDVLLPQGGKQLLKLASKAVPNFVFHRIDLRGNCDEALANLPVHALSASVYTLNPDGLIKNGPIGGDGDALRRAALTRMRKSIACSGNVFVFVAEAVRRGLLESPDASVGYRPMERTRRRSYDDAIALITADGRELVEEPSNTEFGKTWKSVEASDQLRPSIAVYAALGETASTSKMKGLL